MKTSAFQNMLKCFAFPLAVGFAQMTSEAEVTTNGTHRIAPPVLVKSVFVDDPRHGVDPFFPKSTRRQQKIVQPVETNTPPQPNLLLDQLVLKGLSGVKGAPLALINSSTLAVGEMAEIRCGQGQSLKIRLREVRDRSVIIEVDGTGMTRELKLREI